VHRVLGLLAFFFFFFTLVTGPRRSLSLKLSDTRVHEPQIRARLGYHRMLGLVAFSLEMLQVVRIVTQEGYGWSDESHEMARW